MVAMNANLAHLFRIWLTLPHQHLTYWLAMGRNCAQPAFANVIAPTVL
jgi:hypothetical protein